jgi:hypothetical protein
LFFILLSLLVVVKFFFLSPPEPDGEGAEHDHEGADGPQRHQVSSG